MKTAFHKGLRGVSDLLVGILFLYSATLTQATPYNAAVLADNPLLYWTFDEASGNAFSQVNNTTDNELVPQGNATRAASYGILGNAASFDGSSGTNFHAADLFGGTYEFIPGQLWAVEFWFRPDNNTQRYISESRNTTAQRGNDPSFIYGFLGTDQLEVYRSKPTGPTADTVRMGVENVSLGEWHHMVFAFYGNNVGFADNLREMYLDGALVLSDTTSAFTTGHDLRAFAIGSSVTLTNPFFGAVDEYAIYALTGTDLAARQAHVQSIAGHYAIAVPEPGSAMLLGLGLVGLAAFRRRKSI